MPPPESACNACDWNAGVQDRTAQGERIGCEWFQVRVLPVRIQQCEAKSEGLRIPGESPPEYRSRMGGAQRGEEHLLLARKADRRASRALLVSILAVVMSAFVLAMEILVLSREGSSVRNSSASEQGTASDETQRSEVVP